MNEEISNISINPFFLSVLSFGEETNRAEGNIMLEYQKKDIFILDRTIFYQLLRLLKLPIAEYRKFNRDDKSRLLNVYFRTLSTSLHWNMDISKNQETHRVKNGEGFVCTIYSVFSIRKAEKEKAIKRKGLTKTNNKDDENVLATSLLLVGIAFFLYFMFKIIGGS